jgi:hypothetical protein
MTYAASKKSTKTAIATAAMIMCLSHTPTRISGALSEEYLALAQTAAFATPTTGEQN